MKEHWWLFIIDSVSVSDGYSFCIPVQGISEHYFLYWNVKYILPNQHLQAVSWIHFLEHGVEINGQSRHSCEKMLIPETHHMFEDIV